MAQRSHVPKFGTWEAENVAYTAYFETARKGRGVGGRIVNPNDPEERHELIREEQQHAPPLINAQSSHGVGLSSTTNTPNKINVYAPQRLQQEKQHHKESDAFGGQIRSSYHDRAQQKDTTNAPRNHKDRSNPSGFGREEGYSTSSSMHSHQGQVQSKNNQIRQRRDYPPAMSPQQSMLTTKNNQQAEVQQHHRAASVPKFGAWDVTSPQAGAGFTMIFDKVKEERQQAVNKLPTPLHTPGPYSPRGLISDNKPAKSKRFCCFLPMAD
ncbi:hypothetical protein Taro_051760 [Colocasia esculenta]|uniref:RIN4 pathogenic type III effector avirulence factor Avr cleavage site domain-containing protein n=1 Tax=Colocasia esculenta TaxID=4460 RepID=A0A843XI03_COLES|nr:hypothetical protein [Colocasia esculenta]